MEISELKSLYTKLRAVRPGVSDSSERLLSLARAYMALYRAVFCCGQLEREFSGSRGLSEAGSALFKVMRRKVEGSGMGEERSELLSCMYQLMTDTAVIPDSDKRRSWDTLALELFRRYFQTATREEGLIRTGICRCILDYFYFSLPEDDEWFLFLKTTVREWASAFSADRGWEGIGDLEALERIGVMNRNSYMFLDTTCDETVRMAFEYYSRALAGREMVPLHVLGRLYDAAMDGNAYPIDRRTAGIAADRISALGGIYPDDSDERLYALSYRVCSLCEKIMEEVQQEAVAS